MNSRQDYEELNRRFLRLTLLFCYFQLIDLIDVKKKTQLNKWSRQIWALIICLLIAITFPSDFAAQDKMGISALKDAEESVRRWRSRVDDLIKISTMSASSLGEAENAYNQALLAKILWKYDEAIARPHLKKSAELLLKGLKTDDEKELEKNLEQSQGTLGIIFALEKKLGNDVVGKLVANFDDKASQGARQNPKLAELYASIGVQIAKINPQLGLAYGVSSLKFGFAHALPNLIVELNIKDSALADSLIKNAKSLSAGNYTEANYFFAFRLNRSVFEFNNGKAFSLNSQRSVVELFSDLLTGAVSVEQERPRRCGISYYAPWVVMKIDEFLPENSQRFRQNIQLCVPFLPSSLRETTTARSEGISDNVDELLKAAKEAKDKDLKIRFYRAAFLKLQGSKKYEEMTSVLDGLDGDDFREVAPIGWDNWRVTAGYAVALAAFEDNDLPTAFKAINRVPKQLRPFVRKRLVSESSVAKDKQFYFENLNEMQKELNSLEIPFQDAASLYLDLAKFYLISTPTESPIVFREAVKFINKADNENPDNLPDKDWAPMADYVPVNSALLDVDEVSVFAAINEVSSRRSRLKLSLGLLESSLKALSRADGELEKQKSIAAKKKSNESP